MAAFTNQATLSYNGTAIRSNTVTGELLEVLGITKTAVPGVYAPGETITYLITLKTASGASRTFALCENTLSDTAHAAKAHLSEAQTAALKAALGLPN